MTEINFIQVENEKEGSKELFNIVEKALSEKTLNTIGLATGGTMIPVYKQWVASDLDFSNVTTFNLDEYVGISMDNPNGYGYFMREHLFNHKPFKKHYLLNGLAEDLEAECERFENALQENPLDIQVLGVGENGHIAFNEPGTSMDSVTHVATLTPSTIEVNSRFFEEGEKAPDTALTMGIQSILQAKQIILLAYGERKRAAIEKLAAGEVDSNWPITKLLEHGNVTIITNVTL